MRANVAEYELVAPESLSVALGMLAASPGALTPIAGGTELMVALNTGRLAAKRLMSLHRLEEMRFIRTEGDALVIGAGTTFTDVRRSREIAQELPMLAQAASWTGSIANQNRGTVGGNLVNASPAADSPPALLAYEAVLTLVSAEGTRTMPYREFHLGYKKTALGPGELLYSISVQRAYRGWESYIRKVGTRNAQAISKVALAALARVEGGVLREVRVGAASLADRPIRCTAVEAALTGMSLDEGAVRAGRAAMMTEAKPIDDIRSTAKYRAAVAANLLEEFLRRLMVGR